ncbi:MAG: hypothetical protein MUC49_02760 [Raineya sp.]|jgi:signal transduction histidine kinase|nr:hypothetical protein [Raineya sp.]
MYKIIQNNPIFKNIYLTATLGVASSVMGMIMLNTPGFEESHSDLREICLLICLFYISNPLYVIPLCLFTLICLPSGNLMIAVFATHLIPLFILWYVYKWIERKQMSNIQLGLTWCLITVIYYILFLYPILIVVYDWIDLRTNANFIKLYNSLFVEGAFEMITTALITSLYLIQMRIRRHLELTNKNLEELVHQRTQELSNANNELLTMNENLEQLVQERTRKIDAQLNQILKYAHMNSHEVRGPLARMLGLMNLIKMETNLAVKEDLFQKLDVAAMELDTIIRKMNRLLEQEMNID